MPVLDEAEDGRWLTIHHGDRRVRFFVPSVPDTIEKEVERRADFYEGDQLDIVASRLPGQASIIDVGANIGNHTLFFACVARAARVIPIEVNPEVIASLRRNIAANECLNIDLSALGYGVSDREGRGTLVLATADASIRNRGGMTVQDRPDGAVPLRPLDQLVRGPVDLIKVDVEGMAVPALLGAARLLARWHPLVLVEIMDAELAGFRDWLLEAGYRVSRKFPMYSGIDNYLCEPDSRLARAIVAGRRLERRIRALAGARPRQAAVCADLAADDLPYGSSSVSQ